jgi:hypothetical protein
MKSNSKKKLIFRKKTQLSITNLSKEYLDPEAKKSPRISENIIYESTEKWIDQTDLFEQIHPVFNKFITCVDKDNGIRSVNHRSEITQALGCFAFDIPSKHNQKRKQTFMNVLSCLRLDSEQNNLHLLPHVLVSLCGEYINENENVTLIVNARHCKFSTHLNTLNLNFQIPQLDLWKSNTTGKQFTFEVKTNMDYGAGSKIKNYTPTFKNTEDCVHYKVNELLEDHAEKPIDLKLSLLVTSGRPQITSGRSMNIYNNDNTGNTDNIDNTNNIDDIGSTGGNLQSFGGYPCGSNNIQCESINIDTRTNPHNYNHIDGCACSFIDDKLWRHGCFNSFHKTRKLPIDKAYYAVILVKILRCLDLLLRYQPNKIE